MCQLRVFYVLPVLIENPKDSTKKVLEIIKRIQLSCRIQNQHTKNSHISIGNYNNKPFERNKGNCLDINILYGETLQLLNR